MGYADWAPPRAVRGFFVFAGGHDGRCVLEIDDRPGHLLSVAAPSGPPAEHPWLHGVSRDPAHEHALRQLVGASDGFLDFCRRLVAAGYDLLGNGGELFEIEGGPRRIERDGEVVGVLFEGVGHPSTLTWQPELGELLAGPTVVTAYREGDAEGLLAAARDADSVAQVVERLASAGYRVVG